jgi:queuosine precursor transporter
MSNEAIFFIHIFFTLAFSLASLAFGKRALAASVVVQAVLANLFVLKQIELFGFLVTCADAYIVGAMFSQTMLQEFYGEEAAKKTTNEYLLLSVWYLVSTQIHLAYNPLSLDWTSPHFDALFSSVPRIVVGGIAAMFVGLNVNRIAFRILKPVVGKRWISVATFLSISISQVLDSVVFTVIALAGMVASIWHIIFVSTAIKIVAAMMLAPFIRLARLIFEKKLYKYIKTVLSSWPAGQDPE